LPRNVVVGVVEAGPLRLLCRRRLVVLAFDRQRVERTAAVLALFLPAADPIVDALDVQVAANVGVRVLFLAVVLADDAGVGAVVFAHCVSSCRDMASSSLRNSRAPASTFSISSRLGSNRRMNNCALPLMRGSYETKSTHCRRAHAS